MSQTRKPDIIEQGTGRVEFPYQARAYVLKFPGTDTHRLTGSLPGPRGRSRVIGWKAEKPVKLLNGVLLHDLLVAHPHVYYV
jgi:hypothetical protein